MVIEFFSDEKDILLQCFPAWSSLKFGPAASAGLRGYKRKKSIKEFTHNFPFILFQLFDQ